jgi:hypothetical protein
MKRTSRKVAEKGDPGFRVQLYHNYSSMEDLCSTESDFMIRIC